MMICLSGARFGGVFPWRSSSISQEIHDGGDGVDGVWAADGSDGPQILRLIKTTSHTERDLHTGRVFNWLWSTQFPELFIFN